MSQANENKLKHLEFIQAIITRMAGNSFLIKGWSVTLVSAILALAASKDGSDDIVFIALIPVFVFWFLDAYFLRQERLYRKMWDKVRAPEESTVDFDLNPWIFKDEVAGYFGVMRSLTLWTFHGTLLVAVGLGIALRFELFG